MRIAIAIITITARPAWLPARWAAHRIHVHTRAACRNSPHCHALTGSLCAGCLISIHSLNSGVPFCAVHTLDNSPAFLWSTAVALSAVPASHTQTRIMCVCISLPPQSSGWTSLQHTRRQRGGDAILTRV